MKQRICIYLSEKTAQQLDGYIKEHFGNHRAKSMIIDCAIVQYIKDWKPKKP